MTDCDHCTPCAVRRIESALNRIEATMATESEQLAEIRSSIADVHADVRARLDAVRAEVSPEGQAELDSIKEALSSFDNEIGDADGSDTPTDPGTDEPAPGDGDTPANPDAPADPFGEAAGR